MQQTDMASSRLCLRRKAIRHFPQCQTTDLSILLNVHMTGLQMRTASSPVINKAQSKPLLHQGKTSQHKNTGVFWNLYAVWLLIIRHALCRAKDLGLENAADFHTGRNLDYPKSCLNKTMMWSPLLLLCICKCVNVALDLDNSGDNICLIWRPTITEYCDLQH